MKNHFKSGPLPWRFPKIDLKMKLTTIFLIVSLFQVQASSYGQKTKLSLDLENASIGQIFNKIEEISEFRFMFETGLIDLERKISITISEKKIAEVLPLLFGGTDVDYKIRGRQIILTTKGLGASLPKDDTSDKVSHTNTSLQQQVSGTVTDAEGVPLAGANILEKGSTNGTQTDFDGNFSLEVGDDAVLVVSYIGFATKEVNVDGQSDISISMDEDAAGLDEVVVVGYGTQRKSDVTGAVSSISGSDLAETASSSIISQAQGKLAGVDIVNNNGSPGSPTTIRIRGNRSINAGNDPLYVIDGVPTTQGIDDFNPGDIKSLEVLKDASAVAIYGSRGANGVILITTKRGTKGKINIQYNTYYGPKNAIEDINTMNAQQFIEYNRVARGLSKNDGSEDVQALGQELVDNYQNGVDTDWLELALKTGSQTEHQLSASGGSESINYYVSGSYYDEEGVLKKSDFDRLSLRTNLDARLTKRVRIGVSLTASKSERNLGSSRPYAGALSYIPIVEPFDSEGNIIAFPNPSEGLLTSPLLDYAPNQHVDEVRSFRFFSSIFAEYDITKNLTYRLNIGSDVNSERRGRFNGDLDGSATRAQIDNGDETSTTIENLLTFDKDFGNHYLNVVGLLSQQTNRNETNRIIGEVIPIPKSTFYDVDSAERLIEIGSNLTDWTLLSYMARINYRFNEKYLLTATARADGSSRLAEGNKWALFPAVSAGWIISKENFLENSVISFLKLRAGYGEVGNTSIGPYQTFGGLRRTSYAFGDEGAFGFGQDQIANANLGWEISKTVNVGLDFGFLKNRISGSLELYNTKTEDLLLNRQIPTTSGFNNILTNVGSTKNKGWELTLSTNLINNNNFKWNIDLNVSSNKEEIVSLFNGEDDDIGNRWFIGSPINVFYDVQFDGIWQTEEATEAAEQGQLPGDIRIADVNGRDENGELTNQPDGTTNSDDRAILGSTVPDWTGGINNKITYKDFDFSIQINTRQGQLLESQWHDIGGNDWEGRFANQNYNYWTPINPSNEVPIPRAGGAPLYSSAIRYFDGSFIKIRNIILGYSIPFKDAMSLRVYVSAVNPVIFSNYDTVDPENSGGTVGPGVPLSTATYLLGVNFKL